MVSSLLSKRSKLLKLGIGLGSSLVKGISIIGLLALIGEVSITGLVILIGACKYRYMTIV